MPKGLKKRAFIPWEILQDALWARPTNLHNEDLLYNLFGVNAELLIDHAWGWEPCTIADIKAYEPKSRSTGSGQVLHAPHSFREARLIVQEMAELLALDLVEKRLMTDQIHLSVRYDVENLSNKKYPPQL